MAHYRPRPLFTKLRTSEINRNKVTAIPGDIAQPGLGLSLHDRALLQQEVHIVFHMAATVNFNAKLKLAVAINVTGTKNIIYLCQGMDKLKSIVHVSTAYANCHQSHISEKFYKYPMSYHDFPSILDQFDEEAIEKQTPRILRDWPNTYTFTKALGESIVEEMRGALPISIFRPGIVVSSWKEPLQGWIDNIYGPTGIYTGFMMGALGSVWGNDRLMANIVPVDFATNALIACAWRTGCRNLIEAVARVDVPEIEAPDTELGSIYQTSNLDMKRESTSEIDPCIYNYVSTVEKPIIWAEYMGINRIYGEMYPFKNALWYLNFSVTNSKSAHMFSMFFFHFVPALLVDCITILFVRKLRMLRIYKQTNKFVNLLTFFTHNEFTFTNDNVQHLWEVLESRDKRIFPFSMSEMDWLDYFRSYILGIRKYLCKDDESTIPEAKIKRNRLQFAGFCLKLFLYYFLVHYIIIILKKIYTL